MVGCGRVRSPLLDSLPVRLQRLFRRRNGSLRRLLSHSDADSALVPTRPIIATPCGASKHDALLEARAA